MGVTTQRILAIVGAIAVVLAAVVAPSFAPAAEAHAALTSATPANNEQLTRPPTRVVLRFSEAIERRLTAIQVIDKDKKRVDSNDMAFDDNDPTFASVGVGDLAPGLYYVKWSNVSAVDGHELNGQYPFIILNPDGSFPEGVTVPTGAATSGGSGLLPPNIDSALKWLSLLSLAAVAGAAFFLFVGMRPAAAFLEDEDYAQVTDTVERWVVTLSHVLLPVAFISSAFLLIITVERFSTDTSIWSYLTQVRVGQYTFARLGLIAVALAGCDLLFLGNSRSKRNIGLGLMILTTLAALFTYSMVSHSAGDEGKFWTISSDYVHLLASAAWLGALAMILVFLRWRYHALSDAARWLYIANVFDRFSVLAAISVAVILATGTFNGLAAVPTAGAMIHTTYGKVLLAKIALVLLLLGVAGLNAFILKPRFVAAIDSLYQQGGDDTDAGRSRWTPQLRRLRELLIPTVALEIAFVVAVFAAVGVLTQTATAKGEVAQDVAAKAAPAKFDQKAASGGISYELQVTPNQAGTTNEYVVDIKNADGTAATTVTQARLRFNYEDAPNAVAPSELLLTKFSSGEWKGAGVYFTTQGNWRVDMTIRRSDADDVAHAFVLPVAVAPQTTTAGGGSMFALPFKVFNWNEVAGAALALVGGLILIYRRQINVANLGYRATVTGATAVLLAGAVLVFGVHTHSTQANPRGNNPVKPTAASIARGKELFQQNCVQCHGIDGRGDGPEAAKLNPAPTDFRLHMPLHTDPQFYAFIHDGYAGTAMPAFGSSLSADDIWNLVNYLRSAFSGGATQ
jgi:copper transport protein